MADAYTELISDEIKKDEDTYNQLRNRSITLATLASGLVALTTGLLAVAAGSNKDVVPVVGRYFLGGALASFLVTGILTLLVNLPQGIERPSAAGLAKLVSDDRWDDIDAQQRVAEVRVTYLGSLRSHNESRAKLLVDWDRGHRRGVRRSDGNHNPRQPQVTLLKRT